MLDGLVLADRAIEDHALFCIIDRAGLADDRHTDLTGILHGFLDPFGDVTGKTGGFQVVDLFRFDDDANFTSGLDGICL